MPYLTRGVRSIHNLKVLISVPFQHISDEENCLKKKNRTSNSLVALLVLYTAPQKLKFSQYFPHQSIYLQFLFLVLGGQRKKHPLHHSNVNVREKLGKHRTDAHPISDRTVDRKHSCHD